MSGFISLFLACCPRWPISLLYERSPTADRLIRQTMQATYNLHLTEARTAAQALQERSFPTIRRVTPSWPRPIGGKRRRIPETKRSKTPTTTLRNWPSQKARAPSKPGSTPKSKITAYLASAHGSYARFQVTQKEAFFSAMRAGLRAHHYAEQVYELDKNYYDIYVGLGAFNYLHRIAACRDQTVCLADRSARESGDLGVQQLKTAMQKARYSQTEARIVYYTAMLEDKQYGRKRFAVLEQLRADYPR